MVKLHHDIALTHKNAAKKNNPLHLLHIADCPVHSKSQSNEILLFTLCQFTWTGCCSRILNLVLVFSLDSESISLKLVVDLIGVG